MARGLVLIHWGELLDFLSTHGGGHRFRWPHADTGVEVAIDVDGPTLPPPHFKWPHYISTMAILVQGVGGIKLALIFSFLFPPLESLIHIVGLRWGFAMAPTLPLGDLF